MNQTFAQAAARAQVDIACARTLFRDGFLGECHDYMVKALRLQLEAWSDTPTDADSESLEPRAPEERALQALQRAGYRRVDRLRAVVTAVTASERPIAATVAARSSVADFDWIWAEVERLTPFSARHALTPQARKLRRWRRGVSAALAIALVLFVGFRIWGRPRAQASAAYSDDHSAANVVDGSEATEWLLPDGSAGWIDVLLPFARTVHRVRLLNAHNRMSSDRATRAVRVTAFTKQGSSVSVDGAFAHFSDEHSQLDLPLEAAGVTRIRIEVLTHFRSGGGLAEVEID